MEGGEAKFESSTHSGLEHASGTYGVKLGASVVVARCRDENSRSVVVTDFSSYIRTWTGEWSGMRMLNSLNLCIEIGKRTRI